VVRPFAEARAEEDEAVFLVPSMELAHGREISYGYSVDPFGLHYITMLGGYTGNSLTLSVAVPVVLLSSACHWSAYSV
jgi:hypothetical protein